MRHIEGDITKLSTMIVSESQNSEKIIQKMKKMIDKMPYKRLISQKVK